MLKVLDIVFEINLLVIRLPLEESWKLWEMIMIKYLRIC